MAERNQPTRPVFVVIDTSSDAYVSRRCAKPLVPVAPGSGREQRRTANSCERQGGATRAIRRPLAPITIPPALFGARLQ